MILHVLACDYDGTIAAHGHVTAETAAALARVRQSGRYQVWRISHPFRDSIAIRLIVWFPPDAPPVIVLFGNDKAQMGDVFYNSVGSRADQVIAAYLRLTHGGGDD